MAHSKPYKSQASALKFSNKTRAEEVMRLRINQIICTGRITYKRKPEELNFRRKKETLFNNSLTIAHFNFTFNICKNIAFIFNNNINRLLKNCISKVTNENISSLFVKVSNIQYSRKINFNQTTLVNTFLPLCKRPVLLIKSSSPKSQTFQASQL